jgi:hypothetical protein
VTNTGPGSLRISGVTPNRTAGNFSVGDETCTTASPLPAGGSCTVDIVFSPGARGELAGLIRFSSNIGRVNGRLEGIGLAPVVSTSPRPLAFGSTEVGASTAPQTVTVTNAGDAPLVVTGVTPNRTAGNFHIDGESCTVSPVAPGETCTVDVVFTPLARGMLAGLVRLTTNIGRLNTPVDLRQCSRRHPLRSCSHRRQLTLPPRRAR